VAGKPQSRRSGEVQDVTTVPMPPAEFVGLYRYSRNRMGFRGSGSTARQSHCKNKVYDSITENSPIYRS
jgi:hypothetical protein